MCERDVLGDAEGGEDACCSDEERERVCDTFLSVTMRDHLKPIFVFLVLFFLFFICNHSTSS